MNLNDERTTSDAAESANDPAGVYQQREGETTTEAVVRAMSSVVGRRETELKPIYAAVDPDALDALFDGRWCGTSDDGGGYIVFDYEGHRVCVEKDGTVAVYEPE
ncbi:HalOD1 output domain-containing protein [Halorussus sp. MSC15.2]|uniref:HalOD1 output domain-containing protein n=1 Tax=Halorussus sp. MSC15.2 TaxID=2283638 RepID=UPI0013D2E0E7|nr:HalOD1 output domain-containing protein [Halorussus sp. MSC15.2]NEU56863.1 hypothetical protein [Halorussus sp. MSC15.2]